jgi:hypothetical protein
MASNKAELVPHEIQKAFPHEILLHIQSFLPQIAKHLIPNSLRWEYKAKDKHSAAWGGIFKDEVWLSAITEMGFNPVLVGCDLDRYIHSRVNQRNQPSYLALVLGQDKDGGTKCDLTEVQTIFFQSCQKYIPLGPGEYFFPKTGLTLNVKDAIYENHFTYMSEPRKLLSRGLGYYSSYLYWNDNEFIVRKIGRDNVIGVRKGLRKSVSSVIGLEWEHLPNKTPRQHYFAKNGATVNLQEIWGDSRLSGWTLRE